MSSISFQSSMLFGTKITTPCSSDACCLSSQILPQAHFSMLEVRRAELEQKYAALQSKVEASQQAMAKRKEKEVTPDALASKV